MAKPQVPSRRRARLRREEGEVATAPDYVEPIDDDPIEPPVGEPEPPADTPIDPETEEPEPGFDSDYVAPDRIEITDGKQTVVRTETDPGTWGNAYVASALAGPEYWEIEVANSTPNGATLAVGVSTLAMPLNGIPGELPGTIAYWSDGRVRQNGATLMTLATYGRRDRIGIAYGHDGGVRLYKNCAALNSGNAVATQSGSPRFPFVGLYSANSRTAFKFALSKFGCSLPVDYYPIGQIPEPEVFPYVTWDAAAKHANMVLSNDDFTASAPANGFHATRATEGKSTGKFYYEGRIHEFSGTSIDPQFTGLGFCTTGLNTASDSGRVGGGASEAGVDSERNVRSGSDTPVAVLGGTTTTAPTNLQTLRLAADLDAREFWAAFDGGDWNNNGDADPETGVGGIALPAIGTIFPLAKARGGKVSIFATQEHFVYSAPSGYSAWGGSDGTAARVASARSAYQVFHRRTVPTSGQLARVEAVLDSISLAAWNKLDRFVFFAVDDAALSLVNWRSGGSLTANGSTVFDADAYRKGTGGANASTADYLSNIGNENSLVLFKQNNAHMGLYSLTHTPGDASTNRHEFGSVSAYISAGSVENGSGVATRLNSTTFNSFPNLTLQGHFAWTRESSTEAKIYKNGSLEDTVSRTSTALGANAITAFGRVGGFAGIAGGNEIAAIHMGSALTAAEVAELHDGIRAGLIHAGAISP